KTRLTAQRYGAGHLSFSLRNISCSMCHLLVVCVATIQLYDGKIAIDLPGSCVADHAVFQSLYQSLRHGNGRLAHRFLLFLGVALELMILLDAHELAGGSQRVFFFRRRDVEAPRRLADRILIGLLSVLAEQ